MFPVGFFVCSYFLPGITVLCVGGGFPGDQAKALHMLTKKWASTPEVQPSLRCLSTDHPHNDVLLSTQCQDEGNKQGRMN